MISRLAQRLAREVARIPLLRPFVIAEYKRRFRKASGQVRMFHGIYPDFESAARDIPADRLRGYDNEGSALRLAHERFRICPFDYPVMFWLDKLLPECRLLFDLGGNVGTSYFGYRKYLQYPKAFGWLVYEVAAVAALGGKIAAEESATQLRFTTDFSEAAKADVLLSAGVLHFIARPFELLRSAQRLPPHILINKVPAHDLPSVVTLENMGSAFNPYHLFNRADFVENFRSLGYEVADEWRLPDISCEIPLFPQHSITAYSGFYFRRA